ncbi:chemotaxis protein CheB [Myxococcota bacterium]|nr:chemotaxis protein CheB [Myxococcota bacterium]MBU1537922.1 chemotaxis protein CheB [Myxococcota bacterium]
MNPGENTPFTTEAIVMGASAGGYAAIVESLQNLPGTFPLPIFLVQHLHSSDAGLFAEHLAEHVPLSVNEPCDKEQIKGGVIYIAPANYHMAIERGGTISLSVGERVNWSRPSIDVLFESAALVYGPGLLAVILSGANADGARGALMVQQRGGRVLVQDPATADSPVMPRATMELLGIAEGLSLKMIGAHLAAASPDHTGQGIHKD